MVAADFCVVLWQPPLLWSGGPCASHNPIDYLPDKGLSVFHSAEVMFLQSHVRDQYQIEGLISCPPPNHQTPSKHQEIESDYCLPIPYTVSSRNISRDLVIREPALYVKY